MDFQRIIILLGLALTSYFLILAWNEDYGNGRKDSNAPATLQSVEETVVPVDFLPPVENQTDLEVISTVDVLAPASSQTVNHVDDVVAVTTDVLKVVINKKGGDITSVSLVKFPTSMETKNEPFVLVDPRNSYSAQSGIIGPNGTDSSEGRPTFVSAANEYSLGDSEELTVPLSFTQEDGVKIIKEFMFYPGNYLFDIKYRIDNSSNTPWQGAVFAQIKRNSEAPYDVDTNAMGMSPFIGGATWTEEAPYKKLEFDDIEEESYRAKNAGGYVAMVEHYFVSAFVPDKEKEHTYQARKLVGKDAYLFGFTSPLWTVAPGVSDEQQFQFYAGPKDQYRLREISEGLDLTIDYGFLWWMAQPLFFLLTTIQQYVINWGVAIMLLTLVVKALLYPLSAAGFRSNAKLRKLQPEMLRLREQYGDDKQKLSQGMMDLYKKEGTNPLSGCFPLLLQMPVFIALYWVLLESVELRQAPFMLWIQDLSVMDPYFVLPILMGISMYFVTLLQPEPPDPMQAKIFKMMPIMFTFFFLWFPAGLVLYWLVNNVLSILQQWYVTRQIEKS
jgi:YidC/Oxa1 family membrane protein insertase